jgi:hypothetical protein
MLQTPNQIDSLTNDSVPDTLTPHSVLFGSVTKMARSLVSF